MTRSTSATAGRKHARRRFLFRAGKRRALLTLSAVVAIAAAVVAVRLISESGPACQSAVPAYFYPGPDWAQAIASKPVPSIMIMDITSSGAGTSPDRNYRGAVRRAQAAGITIMGYSNTDYTQRSVRAVETDVRNYKAWYNVTDIFLDGVSSSRAGVPYYRRLSDYIHGVNPGSTVMLNPGTYPDRQYMSVGDIVLVYENTYASYADLHMPGWVGDYPAADFAHIIYATPSSQLGIAISLSQRRHAGYVYVTDKSGSNPYGSLPGYWPREDAIIAAGCAGAGGP